MILLHMLYLLAVGVGIGLVTFAGMIVRDLARLSGRIVFGREYLII